MDRRAFLRNSAFVGSITTMGGCSALTGSSYTFENAGNDAWETWGFQPQGGRFVAGGQFSLEPGEWTSRGFSSAINILLAYDFEITAGNGVEFFVVEADEMENFEQRSDPDFRFTDRLEGIGRAATEVTTREYAIVLDNTQFGDMGTGESTSAGTLRIEGEPL
jgi:hypothetical protein